MGRQLDYYDVLGVSRDTNETEIKRAYRRLALKYHPDTDGSAEGKAEFARVSEAYDVLSHVQRKGIYDLYGEEALKAGGVADAAGVLHPVYTFDPATGPLEVFARFFGTANPYEALNAISAQFTSMTKSAKLSVGKQKTYPLELTLEEIYHGCVKQVAHTRKTLTDAGDVLEEQRTLTIDVQPGLPDGTCFVFEGEGHKTPMNAPGPVVFTLKSKKHATFSRGDAGALVHEATLPLHQALCGTALSIRTLDGRKLKVPISGVFTPGKTFTVSGEGMPLPGGAGRGDLIVKTKLLFPDTIDDSQKMLLKAAFFLPGKLSKEQAAAVHKFEVAFKDAVDGWATGYGKDGKQ